MRSILYAHEFHDVCLSAFWCMEIFLSQWLFTAALWVFYLKNVWSFLSHTTLQYPNLDYMWIFPFLPWKPFNFYTFPKHIFTFHLVIYLQYYLWKYETFNLFYIHWIYIFFKHFNENINYQWKTSVKLHLNFMISLRWWQSLWVILLENAFNRKSKETVGME